jgi:hypothetical protein
MPSGRKGATEAMSYDQEHELPDGVDDYYETHDVDDYKQFGDNEAWLDMRGEFDDD